MKTPSPANSAALWSTKHRFGRWASMMLFALLPLLMAMPVALAATPNGVYKVTRVSSSITVNGRVVEIPDEVLEEAFSQNGRIAIRNGKMPIYRAKWGKVMEEFSYFGLDGKVATSGPTSLTLKPSGKSFRGRSSKPVRLSAYGNFLGTRFSVNMKMNFRANVSGRTLIVTVPVDGTAMGLVNAKGLVTLVAKK